MVYVIYCICIWTVVSILFFRKELKLFFFSESERQGQRILPDGDFMGQAHNVFQIEENNIVVTSTGDVLSEEDFEIEYGDNDNIIVEEDEEDDIRDDRTIQETGSIIGFKEMRELVAIVEDDSPLIRIDNKKLDGVRRTIKQIEDTDFFEKLIRTKEDISRRLDDILNNLNN
ncbi:MAG: hypothetical protein LBG80_19735 [Bacteroidales bacterium]|jgi:hypothetical protein|nr:hypothetical protein [Bacteroidales bacterium]